jgi:hypothetical protein
MIPLAITFTTIGYCTFLGIKSLKRVFFAFIFLLPILPYYFAIPVGGGGAGLAAARLSSFILFFLLLVSLLLDEEGWRKPLRVVARQQGFMSAFVVLSVTRLISTLANRGIGGLFYWFDELALSLLIFLLAIRIFSNPANLLRLTKVLTAMAILQVILVFVEVALGRHLLLGVINIQVATVGSDVLDGIVRGGAHRVQTLFDNPLSLAEYLLYLMTALLFLKPALQKAGRWKTLVLVGLLFLAILQTHSRFPFVLLFATYLMLSVAYVATRLPPLQRAIVAGSFLLAGSATLYLLGNILLNFEAFIPVMDDYFRGDEVSKKASIISRGLQYTVIGDRIFGQAPLGLLGEGYRSSILEELEIQLDNYYLRLLIEGGTLAVLSFLVMCLILISQSLKAYRRAPSSDLPRDMRQFLQRFYLFALIFIIQFVFSKVFLSMTFNNYLFFLCAGAFFAIRDFERTQIRASGAP